MIAMMIQIDPLYVIAAGAITFVIVLLWVFNSLRPGNRPD